MGSGSHVTFQKHTANANAHANANAKLIMELGCIGCDS